MKEIKDYLHLYLGCDVEFMFTTVTGRKETRIGKCLEIDIQSVVHAASVYCHGYHRCRVDEVKPILRPLSDMTEEEALHFTWLCLNSPHAPKDFITIGKDEIDVDLHKNDGGNLLDGDVELYIEVSCRCFDGYISIMKDGRIGTSDDKDTPSEEMKPQDDIYGKVVYLLKQGFDLFQLIESGLAIDKTKLNSEQGAQECDAREAK